MEQWKDKIFRTYCRGSGKKCLDTHKGVETVRTFNAASARNNDFGGILCKGLVDVSFDDPEMSEAFLNMADSLGWKYAAFRNPENGHLHTIWKKPKSISRDGKDKMLACGLIADIHSGDTYIPLRANGVDRFPPVRDLPADGKTETLPEELFPVNAKSKLWNLKEGKGRNSALSSRAKYFVENRTFSRDVIIRILTNVNRFIFAEPVEQSELETILRDETFEDMEADALQITSATALQIMDVKPVEFIINGLLPVGLTILASPPKYGKSYMCMDMILSVAAGTPFLGFSTIKSSVLYMALEDRNDRLKQRMQQVLAGNPAPEGLYFTTQCETLDHGLIEQLEQVILETGVRLIVIDTFIKVRGEPKRSESAYAMDSREAGLLKRFADQHGIACLLVTHTRKGIDPGDPFANISGTYGISGAADDMIVLTKDKRSDNLTKMSITGRDVTFEEYPIVFDKDRGRWLKQGDSYELAAARMELNVKKLEYRQSNLRKIITKLVEENGGQWKGRCGEIIEKGIEYGFPLSMTSQQLGKKLADLNDCLMMDRIVHTAIGKGSASAEHKLQKMQ